MGPLIYCPICAGIWPLEHDAYYSSVGCFWPRDFRLPLECESVDE